MQNLKRVLSLVLVVAMVMSFMLSASAATAEQIPDLAESNFQPEVRVLAALDIVEGYEDGSFKPANEVTRAELATILARVKVGGDKEMIKSYNYGHMTYTDVLNNGYVWAAPAIQYATDNGMVVGDGNGLYRPGDTVTVVEGLKMLLTALQYDAEIEGLQNVGAAWKANVLSLAREVGLMDRFYGDTNKNMTRDDMALLIWNFLNCEVVKGYYANNVANVDTIMYFGGTALEIFFAKQVVYGAIVANEKAILNVQGSNNAAEYYGTDLRLPAGQTTLFLYDNDEGESYAEHVDHIHSEKVINNWDNCDYFVTFTNLSTDLADIGEPVFVITDLEPTKGYFVAIGGECFSTGTNTVGVEQWSAPSLTGLVNADTVYAYDYDVVAALPRTLGNGDFYKTVDFDGDGKLDLVLTENWNMTFVGGTDRSGAVKDFGLGKGWNVNNKNYSDLAATNLLDTDFVTANMINWHYADGIYYSNSAECIAKTPLTDGVDAVNYKYGYVTLSDGNKYSQSGIDIYNVLGLETVLINCVTDPKATTNYNWYLDNGGFIRAYGEDRSQYSVYLLTEASSVANRYGWTETVDALQQTNLDGAVTYNVTNSYNDAFVANSDNAPYGALNGALNGKAVTNLALAAVSDDSIELTVADKIVELQGEYGVYGNEYKLTDKYGKLGEWNVNNGVTYADAHVYTTDATDFYVVTYGTDIKGINYVKSVNYVQGYKNLKNVNFEDCTAAYALVGNLNVTSSGNYYNASIVVLESNVAYQEIVAPYFAYEHISDYKDSKVGLFGVIDPTGAIPEEGLYVSKALSSYVFQNNLLGGLLGFFKYNTVTKAATLIEEDFNNYGIFADQVVVVNSNYKVVGAVGGKQLTLTEDTEIYALVNYVWTGSNAVGEDVMVLDLEYGDLKTGDQIIYVTNAAGTAVEYVLVVNGVVLPQHLTYSAAAQELYARISGSNYLEPAKRAAFINAVNAMTLAQIEDDFVPGLDDLFDAELNAFMTWFDTVEMDTFDKMSKDEAAVLGEALTEFAGDLKNGSQKLVNYVDALSDALVVEDGKLTDKLYLDPYYYGYIQDAYNGLTETQKTFLIWLENKAETVANLYLNNIIDSALEGLVSYTESPILALIDVDVTVDLRDVALTLLKAYKEVPDADIAVLENFLEVTAQYVALEKNTDNGLVDDDSYLVEAKLEAAYNALVSMMETKGYELWEDGELIDAVEYVADELA